MNVVEVMVVIVVQPSAREVASMRQNGRMQQQQTDLATLKAAFVRPLP
jgi:hypothetical protein